MSLLAIYALGLASVMGLMTLLWLLSLLLKDSSIVEPFWVPGFVIANWFYFALTQDGFSARKWLISILITTRAGYKDYVETTSAFVPWFP